MLIWSAYKGPAFQKLLSLYKQFPSRCLNYSLIFFFFLLSVLVLVSIKNDQRKADRQGCL